MDTLYRPTFSLVPGYSAIDHAAPELIRVAEARVKKPCYRSRTAALRAGERALAQASALLRAHARATDSRLFRGWHPRIEVGVEQSQ